MKAESISKVWRKTLLNKVDQLKGTQSSSELYSSREPNSEPEDDVLMSDELKEGGFSSVNKADIQEWLTIDRNKSGYTAVMEEENTEAVSSWSMKMTKNMTKTSQTSLPFLPIACLSTSIWWLVTQSDYKPVAV